MAQRRDGGVIIEASLCERAAIVPYNQTAGWCLMREMLDQSANAPIATSHAEFNLNRTSNTAERTASDSVSQSTNATAPRRQVTTAISASEATFTPLRNAPASGE